MAEPVAVGLTSGVLALTVFAFKSGAKLYDTIKDFTSHPRQVRELLVELSGLVFVLQKLFETGDLGLDMDLTAFKPTLGQCGHSCDDVQHELLTYCSRSRVDRTSFRDWAKLKCCGGDGIEGFRQQLIGYKSTITVVLSFANLRASATTTEAIHSCRDLIARTTTDLEAHLEDVQQKLEISTQRAASGPSYDEAVRRCMEDEQRSTEKGLEFCAMLSQAVKRIQIDFLGGILNNVEFVHKVQGEMPQAEGMHLRASTGKAKATPRTKYQMTTRLLTGESSVTVRHNNDGEEDYDITDVESIQRPSSQPSSQSSAPSREVISLAASELATLLLEVEELDKLLTRAYLELGQQQFASNIGKFLTGWGRRLRSEVSGELQHPVAQFVQKSAHQTASQLESQLASASGSRPFQLGFSQPDRSRRVNDWMEAFDIFTHQDASTAMITYPKPTDGPNMDSGNNPKHIEENPDDDSVEEVSEDELEELSNVGDDANISLEAAKTFLRNSKALKELCSDLRRWLDGRLPKRTNNSLNILPDHRAEVEAEEASPDDLLTHSGEPKRPAEEGCVSLDYDIEESRPLLDYDIEEGRPLLGHISEIEWDWLPTIARKRRFPVLYAKIQELRFRISEYMLASMPMFVDSIFESFPQFCEPPVRPGARRIRWKCACGKWLFEDIVELKPGATERLQHDLEQLDITVPSEDDIQSQTAGRNRFRFAFDLIPFAGARAWNQFSRVLGKGPSFMTGESMLHSARASVSGTLAPSQSDQATLQNTGTGSSCAPLLLLCIGSKGSAARLHHISLKNMTHNSELFDILRDRYGRYCGVRSWFTLRGFKSIHLAKFAVDDNGLCSVYHHDDHCTPTHCNCLPPRDMVGPSLAYECGPEPKSQPLRRSREVLPSDLLSHYFRKKHVFKNKQTKIFRQVPKRVIGELVLASDDALIECGWGIYIDEGWHWLTIKLFVGLVFLLGSLVFVVIWAATKGDIQSAFSITSAWMAVGAMLLAYMSLRDN